MKALYKPLAFIAIALYLLSPEALIFAQANGSSPASATTTSSSTTCRLQLSASSIAAGSSVTLKWSSTNATSGAIVGVGNVGPSGSVSLHPSQTTTYIGSFTGTSGTANCSITVRVGSTSTGGGASYGTQNATLGSSNASAAPTAAATAAPTPSSAPLRLVPCGYDPFNPGDTAATPNDASSTGCQACSLAQLVQNLINFLIGLSIPVAAALFAWAGILYFTSAGDLSKRQQAKGIFKNAFIGFVIVITAWLVINTLLHVIFSQGEFSGGTWFTIQCSANRPITGDIGTVIGNVLGTGAVSNPTFTDLNGSSGPQNPAGTTLNNLSQADQDAINSAVEDACFENNDAVSCAAYNNSNTILTSTAQEILQADCSSNPGGSSCTALNDVSAASTASSITAASIAAAAAAYTGTNTSAGPDGGNLACAWAVNNILQNDGITPIDGDSVPAMETSLEDGRGTLVSLSDAQVGDIVIEGNDGHVGIITSFDSNGNPIVTSNSSSNATFTWQSNINFSSPYTSRIYQVNK